MQNVCFCGHDGPNHHFRVGQALRAKRLTHRVGEPSENSCVLRVTHCSLELPVFLAATWLTNPTKLTLVAEQENLSDLRAQ